MAVRGICYYSKNTRKNTDSHFQCWCKSRMLTKQMYTHNQFSYNNFSKKQPRKRTGLTCWDSAKFYHGNQDSCNRVQHALSYLGVTCNSVKWYHNNIDISCSYVGNHISDDTLWTAEYHLSLPHAIKTSVLHWPTEDSNWLGVQWKGRCRSQRCNSQAIHVGRRWWRVCVVQVSMWFWPPAHPKYLLYNQEKLEVEATSKCIWSEGYYSVQPCVNKTNRYRHNRFTDRSGMRSYFNG